MSAMIAPTTMSVHSTRSGQVRLKPKIGSLIVMSGHQRQPSHPPCTSGMRPITPITAMPTIAGSTMPRVRRSSWIWPSVSGSSSHAIA